MKKTRTDVLEEYRLLYSGLMFEADPFSYDIIVIDLKNLKIAKIQWELFEDHLWTEIHQQMQSVGIDCSQTDPHRLVKVIRGLKASLTERQESESI
jgi:hypothetical protein